MANQPNQPIPALVLGLGGSGAATIMHVKQQLLNTYNNQLPSQVGMLVFDTSKQPLSQFKGVGQTRHQGMGFGAIALDQREYGHLGGQSRNLMQRVAAQPDSDENRHLASWLQADWYLKNLQPTLFNLEDGAGQFRQLGRLALFKDVASANSSSFYQRVNEKITTIKRNAGSERSLPVFIIGSLVGGTGAGLFLDAAYLVRKIAESQDMEVQLRGYFYLPDAFRATLTLDQVENAKPRTFAALRELGRLLLNEDYELGYPVHYTRPGTSAGNRIWRSELRGKLYDLVYLVDGKRPNNPMDSLKLAQGAAPSIADAILAFVDSAAGEYQRSYIVNIAQGVTGKRAQMGEQVPYVGGVGTYTIILPIQQIIEKWAFQLGKDVLETILAPEDYDNSSRLPSSFSKNQNQERNHSPEDEVATLLEARNPVPDPEDPGIQHFPTSLWPKIYRWYQLYEQQTTAAVRTMSRYESDEWIQALEPSSADKTEDARLAYRKLQAIKDRTMATEVELSHENKNDPAQDHRRIARDVEKELNNQVGRINATGQRDGGAFGTIIEDLAQLQMARFQGVYNAYLLRQLNGEDTNDFIKARQGKFGWTMAVLTEMNRIFSEVLTLIDEIRGNSQYNQSNRNTKLNELEETQKAMEEAGAQGGMRRGARNKNVQIAYRDAADAVLDLYRAEAARDKVSQLIRQMRDQVRETLHQLETWTGVLATETSSLYSTVFMGQEQILSELNDAGNMPNRYIVDDSEWEQERYNAYVGDGNAVNQALAGIAWKTEIRTNERGQPQVKAVLTLDGKPLDDTGRGNWNEVNASSLMAYCRDIFAPARERETVLNYLANHGFKGRQDDLANMLFTNSGALLNFEQSYVGDTQPGIYLLAYQDSEMSDNRTFLDGVMNRLRAYYGLPEDDETQARLQSCDDRFRLMMIHMEELLPLNRIGVYGSYDSSGAEGYMGAYLAQNPDTRPLLHNFPAEVRAVQYENQLVQSLKQPLRMLSDKVTILLEDIDRFSEFLMLMAHGIIKEERDYRDKQNTNYVYMLRTPPINPATGKQADEWWLTRPTGEPQLIEALMTYLFRNKDHGLSVHVPNYEFPIDYNHVQNHLLNMRQHQTNENINSGPNAFIMPIRDWLKTMNPQSPQFKALARTATEYQALEGLSNWMKDQLTNHVPAGTDTYDLYSVCVLVILEMLEKKRRDAERIRDAS
ncbi:MAG: tubulin-like doman-containing protein [Chloroflexota bacterium]